MAATGAENEIPLAPGTDSLQGGPVAKPGVDSSTRGINKRGDPKPDEVCPRCREGYCVECFSATGEWDAVPCRCEACCWHLQITDHEQQPAIPSGPAEICGWCGTVLRRGAEPVSHGICDPCAAKFAVGVGRD